MDGNQPGPMGPNMPNQAGPMNGGMPNPNMQNQMGQMNQAQMNQMNQMGQMNGNMPNQPVQKQPMDPAKKKRLILGLSIGGGALVLGIVALVVVLMLMKTDYGETYRIAKELEPKIGDLRGLYNCERVADYADASYYSISYYGDYVDECKDALDASSRELVAQLENSSAVKRDKDISEQFKKFKKAYDDISLGDIESLKKTIDLYVAYHSFKYASNTFESLSDSELAKVADYLINSGNETFKKYGEEWLEKAKVVSAAYQAYQDLPYDDENFSSYSTKYWAAYNDMEDWEEENGIDIKKLLPLGFESTSDVVSEFNSLYYLIAKKYAENYDGSGDCIEFLGQVYCE